MDVCGPAGKARGRSSRHLPVGDHQTVLAGANQIERRPAVRGDRHLVAELLQRIGQHRGRDFVIFHHQDSHGIFSVRQSRSLLVRRTGRPNLVRGRLEPAAFAAKLLQSRGDFVEAASAHRLLQAGGAVPQRVGCQVGRGALQPVRRPGRRVKILAAEPAPIREYLHPTVNETWPTIARPD